MLGNLTPKQLAEVLPILKKLQLMMRADPDLTLRIKHLLRTLEENK